MDDRKHRILYTLYIYLGFSVIGWIKGQIGPSFTDLRYICGAGLDNGSWIVTAFFIGYTFGSLISAFLYDNMNRKLLFSLCHLVLVIMLLVIPWCSIYELMVITHLVKGIAEGIIDPVSNTEILRLWKQKGKLYMIGLNLALSIGSVISPLVTAPFLLEISDKNETSTPQHPNTSSTDIDIFKASQEDTSQIAYYVHSFGNASSDLINFDSYALSGNSSENSNNKETSKLYIAYGITASLSMCVGILFLTLYVSNDTTCRKVKVHQSNPVPKERQFQKQSHIPRKVIGIALVIMAAMLFFFNAIDEAYVSYLSSFCIQYMRWTKTKGALVTSVMFILVLVSRLLSLLQAKWINTVTLIGLQCSLMLLSFIGLLVSGLLKADTGIWISAPMVGYSKSVIFGLIFTWTNECFTEITGKLSSAFFVTAMIGSSVNPIVLGSLMETVSKMWFCYLFVIESTALLIFFIVGAIFTRHTKQVYGTRFSQTNERTRINVSITNHV